MPVHGVGVSKCLLSRRLVSALLAQVDLIQWDIPKKALMEMASITSKEMGGTSGAVGGAKHL